MKSRDRPSTKYNVDKPVDCLPSLWVWWMSLLWITSHLKESFCCCCLAYVWNVKWVNTHLMPAGFCHVDCSSGHPALQVFDTSLSGQVPVDTADTWLVTRAMFLNNRNKDGESPSNVAPRTLWDAWLWVLHFPCPLLLSWFELLNLFWFFWFIYKMGIIIIHYLPHGSLLNGNLFRFLTFSFRTIHTVISPVQNFPAWLFLNTVFFSVFLGLHPWLMEVPSLGVESELQLPAYATATETETRDPSHVCNLHYSSRQYWIHYPLIREGQGSNPHPHGYSLGLSLLSHDRNFLNQFECKDLSWMPRWSALGPSKPLPSLSPILAPAE